IRARCPRSPRSSADDVTYRVVQWATGAQGTEAIRAVLDSADYELVGAKVYSDEKHGRDAAELVGRAPVGVLATIDVGDILALAGLTRRIDRITLQERADWSFYESTSITFDNMRFGQPLDEVSEDKSEFLRFNSGIFIEEVWLLADSLNAGIDEVTTEVEVV